MIQKQVLNKRLFINTKSRFFFLKLTLLFLFLSVQTVFSQGFKIPEKPAFETSVYDYIGLLSRAQKSRLENKLIKYSDTTSTQIIIAIINSTEGENISYLAANWGEKWGFGQAKEDNGVFVLLAKADRRIAIQAGKGTEHLLTDFTSRRIIEREIIPAFKQGDYYAGLNKGTDAIFKTLNGEYYQGTGKEDPGTFSFFPILFFIIMIIFFIIIFRGNKKNRGGGNNSSKRNITGGILEAIILSNAGRGSFGNGGGSFGGSSSGGFGGGGFSGGFGGGSFGGGGASGGW